jgi:UDP-N-acetylmuramyl pentapeptide phosphotransferase/UDP-N-acetylglucosamine-1-phosphate transferase
VIFAPVAPVANGANAATVAFIAAAFVIVALATYAGVRLIERIAYRRQWLDHPTHRGSHEVATARGGGLAFVTVTLIGSAMLLARFALLDGRWIAVLLAAAVIAAVSWIDDLQSLPSSIRFAVHIAAAIVVVMAFGAIDTIVLPGMLPLHLGAVARTIGMIVTVICIAGLTNAYNFMDGIDGIAAAQAVIAGLAFAALACWNGLFAVAIVAALIGASAAGFLLRNWSPATIFMGDVGSAFLGFVFALLPVAASHQNPRFVLTGVLLLWPFVFDSAFTILRRLRNGENITQPHRTHLYQRLVRSGLSHATVAALYAVLALLGAAAAFLVTTGTAAVSAYALILIAAFLLWLFVLRRERIAM